MMSLSSSFERSLTRRASLSIGLSISLSLRSCYMSSAGSGYDGREDVGPEIVQEEGIDAREDRIDLIDEPEVEIPPFTGMDFVVENHQTDPDAAPYYFRLTGWGDMEYSFTMSQLVGEEMVRVDWVPPWCTVECSEDVEFCCIDCALMLGVRVLEPGESITIHWDGSFYAVDTDLCSCGCYFPYRIPGGSFNIILCGYTSYVCYGDAPCAEDPGGLIWNADVSGDPECISYVFEIPYDSGETVIFSFPTS